MSLVWTYTSPALSTAGYTPVTASRSITSGKVDCVERFWTWQEAIAVASRAAKRSTSPYEWVRVRREGDRWVVRYRDTPALINGGTQ